MGNRVVELTEAEMTQLIREAIRPRTLNLHLGSNRLRDTVLNDWAFQRVAEMRKGTEGKQVYQRCVRPAGHDKCMISTNIADRISHGSGRLDENGFWEHPCHECARAWEAQYPGDRCWPV